MDLSLTELQERIGYTFRDIGYLRLALTHSSFANETGVKNHHLHCNERLEFLGDSVLSVLTSQYLYRRFPEYPEGKLSQLRSKVVCEDALFRYSGTFELGKYLLLGKGEANTGGAQKPAKLADAFEAILAAIYLDAGESGMECVSAFLMPFIRNAVDEMEGKELLDSKSRLANFIQQDRHEDPADVLDYRVTNSSGPDHAKNFEVELYLDSNRIGCGKGTSIQHAEQEAATDALRLFGFGSEDHAAP